LLNIVMHKTHVDSTAEPFLQVFGALDTNQEIFLTSAENAMLHCCATADHELSKTALASYGNRFSRVTHFRVLPRPEVSWKDMRVK